MEKHDPMDRPHSSERESICQYQKLVYELYMAFNESKMNEADFAYWWSVPGEWVETVNERRRGWSGMMRVLVDGDVFYVKRQCNHLCRTLAHPFGWPTASREWRNLKRLGELGLGRLVPVFHGVRKTPDGLEAVLVTEELRGYRDLASQRDLEIGQRQRLAEAIGEVLAVLHHARLQHTGLYDKHVMIKWDGDKPAVALIDLEKMRRRLTRAAASRHALEQFKRRQQVFGEDDWQILLARYRRRFRGD